MSEKRAATLRRRAARKEKRARRPETPRDIAAPLPVEATIEASADATANDPPWYVQDFQAHNDLVWARFEKTPAILPSLDRRPGKQKRMYRQRREACAAVGRANGHFCNLETLQIGYPCKEVPGGCRYRTQKERAESQGIGLRRFRRAEKDMRDANLYPCYKRVTEPKQDGTKRGRAWARTINPDLYKAGGTWGEVKRLRRECYKVNQEKREAPDEAGKARVALALGGLLRPKAKKKGPATAAGRLAAEQVAFEAKKAEALRALSALQDNYGVGAPPKPT